MEILQFKSKFPREVLLCRVCYYLTFYLICIFYDFEWNKNMVFHRFLNKGKWNLNAVKTGMVHSQSLRDLSEIAFRHIIFLCFLFTYYSPNPNWEIHLITVTCYLSCYELSTILTCKWQEFIIFEYLIFFTQVGDFYEAIGFDACILVEHAGLNPFGGLRSDSIPKAGCPVVVCYYVTLFLLCNSV